MNKMLARTVATVTLSATIALSYAMIVASQPLFESSLLKSIKKKINLHQKDAAEDLVYVQTDKTLYKPGETVWFTAYLRDAATLKPAATSDIIHVEWINPKGNVEQHVKLVAEKGAANAEFELPGAQMGGIYKLKAYTEYQKNFPGSLLFEKEITVQRVVTPRLKLKVDFEKKAYGKGDTVKINFTAQTNENKALANKALKVKLLLNGLEQTNTNAMTDAAGKAILSVALPKNLNTIDGLVNVLLDFEGNTESISRSVPIVLNKISLEFFPEGGDLVNGVSSRVGFRALNEFDKPADVSGVVIDSKGRTVASFSSLHMGMGDFDFTPVFNEMYRAVITQPSGIPDEYSLPEPLRNGYVMRARILNESKLECRVYSPNTDTFHLIGLSAGKINLSGTFKAIKGWNTYTFETSGFPMGITQLTLLDNKSAPRCERLLFVHPDKQLNIQVSTDKKRYETREKVAMKIRVTDNDGAPVAGRFSLSVVDDNLISFADDKQGNILSKIFLEPELKEKIEEPNFYFDPKEPKASAALDLLMLSSGWRRYTWNALLDGQPVVKNNAAEQAIIAGRVMDANQNKGLANAEITIDGSKQKWMTDSAGKFSIRGFNLADGNLLRIKLRNKGEQTQVIDNYRSDIMIWAYEYKRYYDRDEQGMVPQAAMGAGGVREAREVALMDAVVVNKNIEMRRKEKPTKAKDAEANMKEEQELVVNEAADLELLKKDDEEKPNDEANNLAGDIADSLFKAPGFDDLQQKTILLNDKRAAEMKVKFVRGKEFPRKKYNQADLQRTDFATTVFWDGMIETDRNGRASVEFVNCDALTSYRAVVEGFGDNGLAGRGEAEYTTQAPVSIDTKLPEELVAGDRFMIPVIFKNNTSESITGSVEVASPAGLSIKAAWLKSVALQAGETRTLFLDATAGLPSTDSVIIIKFSAPGFGDKIVKPIRIRAKGFPVNQAFSGQDVNKDFYIHPQFVVNGTLRVNLSAYPSVLSELMSGVESILREPYGCFEQTSASNYPNIMVLDYIRSMQVKNPAMEAKANQLLASGYQKLVAFETAEKGYEWFGQAPAHEALTAYGLMEFMDMKRVYGKVDQAMIDRTAALLMDKRDGEGNFKRNPRALDSFGGAEEDITNAYIVYALSESGQKDIQREFNKSYRIAKEKNDPYTMALMAAAAFNLGEKQKGLELLQLLKNAQATNGSWTGTRHSITRSTGISFTNETSALVALALMKSPEPMNDLLQSGIKFLSSNRVGYGGFGSTQATVLVLKALTEFAKFSKKTEESGTIQVFVDDKKVTEKAYEKGLKDNIDIQGLEAFLPEGKHKITVRFAGVKNALPYNITANWSTTQPPSSPACALRLESQLMSREAKVGETVRLSTTLKNNTNEGQPMSMVIIGIPAGCSAQIWQLKEMKDKGVFDFYETLGNNVVIYYRSLAPGATRQINLDLKAELPGQFESPASSAYLYYTAENKQWAAGNVLFVKP